MSFFAQFFGKKRLDYRKRYELLQEAISGTMSQVYKARDKETGELVAVKILDMNITKKIESRWKSSGVRKPTEGEISIVFDHPYIVKTLDQGLTTDGEQYLIMEYLEGTGLNNVLLIPHDMMAGSRTFYMRQVAEAVAEVHKQGFIHHDICPRNLLFSGDASILKLTDFGLSLPNKPPFTDPGNRTGTANYMAPELVRRRPKDTRIDIFSFGVTMYEMYTNELPWVRGTSDDPAASLKVAMHHSETPEPITKYRPQILPAIAKAIHSCIEPDVNKRCPDMQHFLRMIQHADSDDQQ